MNVLTRARTEDILVHHCRDAVLKTRRSCTEKSFVHFYFLLLQALLDAPEPPLLGLQRRLHAVEAGVHGAVQRAYRVQHAVEVRRVFFFSRLFRRSLGGFGARVARLRLVSRFIQKASRRFKKRRVRAGTPATERTITHAVLDGIRGTRRKQRNVKTNAKRRERRRRARGFFSRAAAEDVRAGDARGFGFLLGGFRR